MMRVVCGWQVMSQKDGHIKKWFSVIAIIGCLSNYEMVRSAFHNPSIPLSLTRTNIHSAMTKNPSLLRHTSFRTFGSVKRAPFWCLIYEGCLKTYVLISKQLVLRRVRLCWGRRRNNAHVEKRRGWNNHPFNSRIPTDAISIVLIDCDYSDSW